MNNYDNEYYIFFPTFLPSEVRIRPHIKNKNVVFDGIELPIGGAPLFFEQGFKEKDARTGQKRQMTDIMSGSGSFIVTKNIRTEFIKYDLTGMAMYPAVMIDNDDKWNENYWFMNIWRDLDCWSRNNSVYDELSEDEDEDDTVIDVYHLDENVLDIIPLENRLIFRMANETMGYIFFHRKVVDFLKKNNFTGGRFIKVIDFKEGDQL